MPNVELAQRKMKTAADLCVDVGLILDRYDQYVATRDTKIKPQIPPTDPLLTKQLAAINKKIEDADTAAKKHEFEQANSLLAQVVTDSKAAAEHKKAGDAYATRLGIVQPLITGLTSTSPRKNDPAIGADIEKVDLALVKAETAAAEDPPNFAQASKALEQAATGTEVATLKKKMKGNAAPTPDELESLMRQPGGAEALDEIIEGLDPNTVNQEVFAEAMKVRFKTEFKQFETKEVPATDTTPAVPALAANNAAPDKSVKAIYKLLKDVPTKHAKDNPKLAEIIHYKEDKKGADYGGGKVSLYCGQSDSSSLDYNDQMKVGSPMFKKFFPDGLDPECDQANEDSLPYFNVATLHEVGHAVDDKKGFMKKNGSDAKFGGWEDYGADVTPVATKAAEHFFGPNPPVAIVTYLAKKLTDESSNPPPPFDKVFTAKLKTKADAWCVAIRSDKGLWWDGSSAKANAIGGRVYQESYERKWVSYLLAARSQGIHGYQFRAPGEWFAEIYAAFFAGKLKPKHPAVNEGKGWLGQMKPPVV